MIRRTLDRILDAAFGAIAVRLLAAMEICDDCDDLDEPSLIDDLVAGADRLRAAMAKDAPIYNATCAHLARYVAADNLTDERLAEFLKGWGTE